MPAALSLMHHGETARGEGGTRVPLVGEDAGRTCAAEAVLSASSPRFGGRGRAAAFLVRRRCASIKNSEPARARWAGSVQRTPKGLTLKREDAGENLIWSYLMARSRS
jgi:hypothetical protein